MLVHGPGDLSSIPGRVILKTQVWYLMSPCSTHSIIRNGSRVKWSNWGKGIQPSLQHCEVAMENEASGSPSITVANLYIYIYIYTHRERERQTDRQTDRLTEVRGSIKMFLFYPTAIPLFKNWKNLKWFSSFVRSCWMLNVTTAKISTVQLAI